jgi:SAM-dependent methyltransferase
MSRPLNIGCGGRYHKHWINLDLASSSEHVIAWDLRRPIPLPDASVPFVYSSHMLEHLRPEDAETLMRDVYRVLAPNGIARIVVPDLAKLARWYLEALEGNDHDKRAEWSRIHLIDQLVRDRSGGTMRPFLERADPPDVEYALRRMGSEVLSCVNTGARPDRRVGTRLRQIWRPGIARRALARLRVQGSKAFIGLTLGSRGREAFDIGWFATAGERHRWMYDAQNLTELFRSAGLKDVREQTALTSGWPEWIHENLDVDADGTVYKPESIFMEGSKLTVATSV